MLKRTDLNEHSNLSERSTAQKSQQAGPLRRFQWASGARGTRGEWGLPGLPGLPGRGVLGVLALIGLMAAGRLIAPADEPTIDRSQLVTAQFLLDADVAVIQRADVLQDIIDLLEEIIDILDGKTPAPEREPDKVPEEPVLTDEERDEANDAADDARDAGVAVTEDRIEGTWNYHEVRTFLGGLINAIEDFKFGGGN